MSVESNPVLLVLSGPSGVGKTTVAKRLLSENNQLARVVTCTTRAPRKDEVNGGDYFFLSEKEFMRRVEAAEFLEYAEVYGKRYGTMRSVVREMLASGMDVLLVNDVQGAMSIIALADQDSKLSESLTSVCLTINGVGELRKRLEARDTDDLEVIEERLAIAEAEMEHEDCFDHVVVSGGKNEDWMRLQAIYISAKYG